jgi:hypothetical protein
MNRFLLLALAFCLSFAARDAAAIFGDSTRPTNTVFEYYNIYLKHYFLTVGADEMNAIEHGSAGPGWVRTGWTFEAYAGAPGTAGYFDCAFSDCGKSVARFYGPSPNSHFYTADPAEADGLKRPGTGWLYERDEFSIPVPNASGQCATGLTPVYRLYNNRFVFNDSNHRYVTDAGERAKMQSQGWLDEGVRFCAYRAGTTTVKSYVIDADLTKKILPSEQCEDESINRGPCIAVNGLPAPATKYQFPDSPPNTSAFVQVTGYPSTQLYVADTAVPSLSEFLQYGTAFDPTGGAPLPVYAIHVDSSKRFPARALSSINPLYQFHTTADAGAFDDRFFPWAANESPTELRIAFGAHVKTINAAPGSAAYGHPTIEFIDTKSGHHVYFTVLTYFSQVGQDSDYLARDSFTGKVIVGTTFRANTAYGRSVGLPTMYTPPGADSRTIWDKGGDFDFRMNADEFARVIADARKLDTTLSNSPPDYIIDNFHFNNEVANDGEIGVYLEGFRLEVVKR